MLRKLSSTCIIIMLMLMSSIPSIQAIEEKYFDYTSLRPAPSIRLENIAKDKERMREGNQRMTAVLGCTLFIAGIFSANPLTIGALEAAGASNLITSYVLYTYRTPEEGSLDKVSIMSTENPTALFNKEKIAAEEITYLASRSASNTLDGPYGIAVISTTLAGSYHLLSGNLLGGLSLIGTYTCLPKDARVEDQAQLLSNDIENYNSKMLSLQD